MPKVSIIVPIYNVEEFIRPCIDSILSQTLKNIEIILVDDGSTDLCPAICDQYAKRDKRVRVIHKENQGLGATYNRGIDAATGDYIGIVEADDIARPEMFEHLYELAKRHDADIAKCEWYNWHSRNNALYKDNNFYWANSYEVINARTHPQMLQATASIWSAIYNRKWLKKSGVRFLETPGASYQDVSFTIKAFCMAERMVITTDAFYLYRQDNENASVKSRAKVRVIFDEFAEVDRFFNDYPEYKRSMMWVHKMFKQWKDFTWNLERIAPEFKVEFLQEFSRIFNGYLAEGVLPMEFMHQIDWRQMMAIMREPVLYCHLNYA